MEEQEEFKRANFFPGLKATPAFWNEMEEYHFKKEKLYNNLFHGYGIVPDFKQSMHVQAEKTKGGLLTLLVGSGLAFDGNGNPVFLYEPKAIVLDPKKYTLPCTVYITIRYEERLEDYYENKENSDLQGYQHRKETSKIEITSEKPKEETSIELARIRLEDNDKTGISEIKNNEDFTMPEANMLDYRFVPWATRMKKGMSSYLKEFLTKLLEQTENIANSSYDVVPLVSLRNLQTVAMTSKMIMQTTGVFFDDLIHMMKPIFNMDHQIMFELSDWEMKSKDESRKYTTKSGYEEARRAMYELGDMIKAYTGSYDEMDNILRNHKAVIEGLKTTLVEEGFTDMDVKYISTQFPTVLLFNNEKYTLVDSITMGSEESIESHKVRFIGSQQPSTSNEIFSYPDGAMVRDVIKRWIGGEMKFTLKNMVKGRKTLLVRRTDIHQGNYSVEVKLNETKTKVLAVDGTDTKNRWRNLYVIFEEGEIADYTPEISFDIGNKGRDNSASIWVYQLL